MNTFKTKSLQNIDDKMQGIEESSFRHHVLKTAKDFKLSWIALGQALYTVWKDKVYKNWGFASIEGYATKEIGIKKLTVMKLLRSYYFLEKEEPGYLAKEYTESASPAAVPTYEAIDLLRKAKGKKTLDQTDYTNFKKDIFEKGKDIQQVKRDLTTLIRQRKELDPHKEKQRTKTLTIRRFLVTLKSMKREIEITHLLPASILKETESLIKKLEAEVI
jgi:hypothetical protein